VSVERRWWWWMALCFCCVRACGVGERGKGERLLTLDLEGSIRF
jgi:hypothetical protein